MEEVGWCHQVEAGAGGGSHIGVWSKRGRNAGIT
jgi:hypothetical protein